MKKLAITSCLLFCCCIAFSQYTYYAAAKAGLSLREQPTTTAKVVDKVPYGDKVITVDANEQQTAITTEGFNGFWWKVKYNNKTGYIVNCYVLPVPPPATGIKTFKDYFTQVSVAATSPVVINKKDAGMNETGESTITKQIYKNGMEWQKTQGYENGADLYLLPDITIEQAFLLIRLIGQYPDLIGDKDGFPVKNTVSKNEMGEKGIEVEREKNDGKPGPVKKIRITLAQGAYTEFEIFLLNTQAVIFWSSGV